jgi:hypothetical protein
MSPNPQVAVYLLPVRMAPSPIFLSSCAFPGQVSVIPAGASFFFFKKSLWLDGLRKVCLPFVALKLLVVGRERRKERWEGDGREWRRHF